MNASANIPATKVDFEGLHRKFGVAGWKEKKFDRGFCKYGKTRNREHNYIHLLRSAGGIMLECKIPYQHVHPSGEMIIQCQYCFRQMAQEELGQNSPQRAKAVRKLVRIK